jgi:hypothetical protein
MSVPPFFAYNIDNEGIIAQRDTYFNSDSLCRKRYEKIYEKSRKKGLTTGEGRSNIRHVRDREASGTEKDLRKNFKKLKKGVDKRNGLRYTNKAVAENDSEAP